MLSPFWMPSPFGLTMLRSAGAAPVALSGIADQSWTEGVAITPLDVSTDFTGTAPITYALAPSSAALPAGLSLSSAGIISGTPTTPAAQVNIVVRGTNSQGYADTAFGVTITADVPANVEDATAIMGSQQLAGDGAYQIVDSAGDPVTNASDAGGGTASGYSLSSGGLITPSTDGALAAQNGKTINITCDQGTATITLLVESSTYVVLDSTELAAALSEAGTSGGTIILRDGDYGDIGTISTLFATEMMLRSETYNDTFSTAAERAGGGATISSMTISAAKNLTLQNLRFKVDQEAPTTDNSSQAIITLSGTWDRIKFHRCEIASSEIEKTARGHHWRRGIGKSGTDSGTNFTFTENYVHDLSRGFSIPLSNTTTDNQNSVERNLFEDCYQIGPQANGSNYTLRANVIRNLFSVDSAFADSIIAATSNTVTISGGPPEQNDLIYTDLFFESGDSALQSNDPYTVTGYDPGTGVITIDGTFPVTPAGTEDVRLRDPSQAHQSYAPYTPDTGSDASGINMVGNICGPLEYRRGVVSIAGLKLDDRGGTGTRYTGTIHGNVMLVSQNIALEINNAAEGSVAAYNALVYDEALNMGTPAVYLTGDETSYAVVKNNVSAGWSLPDGVATSGSIGSEYLAEQNLRIGKTTEGAENLRQEQSDLYDGPSFTNIAKGTMLNTFNPKTGGLLLDTATYGAYGLGPLAGYVTFDPDQETLPVDVTINGTLPPAKVPGKITSWAAVDAATASTATITISSLTGLSNGSEITDVEYDVDGSGSWSSVPSFAGTGSYDVSLPTDTADYTLRVRAVNSIGAGSASDGILVEQAFSPQWMQFDGDHYLLRSSDLSGIASSSTKVLYAITYQPTAGDLTNRSFVFLDNSSTNEIRILIGSTAKYRIDQRDSTDALKRMDMNNAMSAGTKYLLLVSFDTVTNGGDAVVIDLSDGSVFDTKSVAAATALEPSSVSGEWVIGDSTSGEFTGQLERVMYWDNDYADVSQTSVQEYFHDGSGNLKSPADVITSIGSTPIVNISGTDIATGTNAGTGGNFVPTGTGTITPA